MPPDTSGGSSAIPREAERQQGMRLAGLLHGLVDEVARRLHYSESMHLHDGTGPVERCGYCYLRAGRTLGVVGQVGGDETTEVLLPLVTWLLDHEPDRYAGNHCIDVAIDLLNEARANV